MKGIITNRESFLGNIALRLQRERIKTEVKPVYKYNPQDLVLSGATMEQLMVLLKEQCKNIHTKFVQTDTKGLSRSIREAVISYGEGPIVAWKDDRLLQQLGLSDLLEKDFPEAGIDVYFPDRSNKEESITKICNANIGITISEITLAESGTAVLFSGKDRGRTVSFLPESSIMIIPKSTIVPRMTQAARLIEKKVKNGEQIPSCINFITGPSNSADIEMVLVVGVHGPIRVTYIVVEDI